jgi:hypothetical protein
MLTASATSTSMCHLQVKGTEQGKSFVTWGKGVNCRR